MVAIGMAVCLGAATLYISLLIAAIFLDRKTAEQDARDRVARRFYMQDGDVRWVHGRPHTAEQAEDHE